MKTFNRFALHAMAVALASAGLASQAQAASYAVPAGVVNVNVTLAGGGGGGGGFDAQSDGGAGGAGALLGVTFPVTAGDSLTYGLGTGGAPGGNWTSTTEGASGPGGTNNATQGAGGAGGLGTFARTPGANDSGSGGGGGGGAASWANVNALWAVAGGGGGGGGGSWQVSALAGLAAAAAASGSCGPVADGQAGLATALYNDNATPPGPGSGGGGGGGGGGFPAGAGGAFGGDVNKANQPAQGGQVAGSCYSPGLTAFTPPGTAPVGGSSASAGSNSIATAGSAGTVSLIPNAVPTLTPGAPGSGEMTVGASLPPPVYPTGFTPTGNPTYTFTCDNGLTVPLGATLPATVTGLAPNTYNCTVIASVTDGTTTITTPVSGQATATLQAAPPPGTVTPTMSAGDSTVTINGTLPPGVTPADVANYTVTCNPALPVTNPVTTLPLTVAATNGTNYVCSVDATLTAGGSLSSNGTANAKPQAPVAGTVAPVPTLGEGALLVLGGLLAALGLRRRRA